MKSPGDSGSMLSMKARMPPHWACPSTTMCFTPQGPNRIFQRRQKPHARRVRLVDRHQIGDVAHHEQFAGTASKITSGDTGNRSSRSP